MSPKSFPLWKKELKMHIFIKKSEKKLKYDNDKKYMFLNDL